MDYDISAVLETVDFSDGSSESVEYCSPNEGQTSRNYNCDKVEIDHLGGRRVGEVGVGVGGEGS